MIRKTQWCLNSGEVKQNIALFQGEFDSPYKRVLKNITIQIDI